MKNLQEIKDLLNKYYDGRTSREEELQLDELLSGGNLHDHLKADADLFHFFREQRNLIKDKDLEQSLDQFIQSRSTSEQKSASENSRQFTARTTEMRRSNRLFWLGGMAAAILILASLFIDLQIKKRQPEVAMIDTYEDPREAYEQARRVIYYVSETMNTGTAPLKSLEKLDEGINYMHPVFSFGSGMKYLEHLNAIERTKQLIEKQ